MENCSSISFSSGSGGLELRFLLSRRKFEPLTPSMGNTKQLQTTYRYIFKEHPINYTTLHVISFLLIIDEMQKIKLIIFINNSNSIILCSITVADDYCCLDQRRLQVHRTARLLNHPIQFLLNQCTFPLLLPYFFFQK